MLENKKNNKDTRYELEGKFCNALRVTITQPKSYSSSNKRDKYWMSSLF